MRSGSLKWPPERKIFFPEEARRILKRPAGKLITGDPDDVARRVKSIIEFDEPTLVVAVGDYTSKKLRDVGARVNLYIIDGRVERKATELFKPEDLKVVRVVNEAGTLNPDAVKTLHKLLRRKELKDTILLVDGEEDLLTLAAILSAPDQTIIVYGQPGKGSVVVRVDDRVRDLALNILKLAKYVD
ncbi:MAG: hypothetical protein DRN68_02085 [Thaumarchaeota archaeon]|nr:MAG: hypothetical protein DRN68_02085 [Nitrososphaerota archaeon]